MPDTFRRLASRDIGTTPVAVGGYTVPAGGYAIVIGMSLCNDLSASTTVTLEIHDGANSTRIVLGATLAPGQTLAPIGEVNKLVLQAGDSLRVTAGAATAIDAVISILETTP